jgi:lipoprotein-anchoring transpeptidase ErfK/SrfK
VPMPFYMRLSGRPFGMHAGYLPGYPASHGCIRMPKDKAILFFKNVLVGTSVRILPN